MCDDDGDDDGTYTKKKTTMQLASQTNCVYVARYVKGVIIARSAAAVRPFFVTRPLSRRLPILYVLYQQLLCM